uniref:Uncharacterized protein n=1 Tax=Parascaris equorum TaxID=6256 RepID=A0A914RDQ5_PAREQ
MVQLCSMPDSASYDLLHTTKDLVLTVDNVSHLSRLKLETVGDIRLQMENEWSMDFAFPLLSLLKEIIRCANMSTERDKINNNNLIYTN